MKITIDNLGKVFKDGTLALANVNLVIENGIFGLLGPNASGKTTLIRILATLLKPSSGTVLFDGMDLRKNRAAIRSITGYLPQSFSSFRNTTAYEFLDYSASLAGLHKAKVREKAVNETLEALGLYGVRNQNANELSIVMKRHLEIAQAMIGNPKILIIDEPTVGLSPEERISFHKLLAERFGKIEIILFSTHILSDISSACKKVAYLDKGEVAYQGPPENLPRHIG
ncbi:MAG: ATP-binding cassette domain-containing protein [Candidatus Latescibacteria bacterium]|nr:ATP-binding cassette domain-containing protein [Candidatus Latescibacterota bacterium]